MRGHSAGAGKCCRSAANCKTVHRQVLTDLANARRDEGVIDERETFIDASVASARGSGAEIGPTRRGAGSSSAS